MAGRCRSFRKLPSREPALFFRTVGDTPLRARHMGGGGDPLLEKKRWGGRGITPLPPRSANGTFSARPRPSFRVESPAGNRVFRHFPGMWRFACPGAGGGGGYPHLARHMGGGRNPLLEKRGGGVGGSPPPPRSANGTFSARFEPLFRGEVLLGRIGGSLRPGRS